MPSMLHRRTIPTSQPHHAKRFPSLALRGEESQGNSFLRVPAPPKWPHLGPRHSPIPSDPFILLRNTPKQPPEPLRPRSKPRSNRAAPLLSAAPLMSMSCSSDSGWLFTGSVPFSAMYFSMRRRSYTWLDTGDTHGCSGTSLETADKGRDERRAPGRPSRPLRSR